MVSLSIIVGFYLFLFLFSNNFSSDKNKRLLKFADIGTLIIFGAFSVTLANMAEYGARGRPCDQYEAGENHTYKVNMAFRQGTNDMAVLQRVEISQSTFEIIPVNNELRLWQLEGRLPVVDGEYVIATKENGRIIFKRHPSALLQRAEK